MKRKAGAKPNNQLGFHLWISLLIDGRGMDIMDFVSTLRLD
jgi:hypothetical protein